VTYIDKQNEMTVCSLAELVAHSLQADRLDPPEAKYIARLMEKLRYCKEVLHSIHDADRKKAAGAMTPDDVDADAIPGLGSSAGSAVPGFGSSMGSARERASGGVGLEARGALDAAHGAFESARARPVEEERGAQLDLGAPPQKPTQRPLSVAQYRLPELKRDAGGPSVRARDSRLSMR
jgi:hypothetical protein